MARGKGEGSIYRRNSDSRWVAQIEAGRAPNGQRRYARAVRRTRKEAQAALKDLQRAADAGVTPGQASTVATFMGWWLTNVVPGGVTEATVARYRRTADDWIIPYVGTIRLNRLTPADVQRMLVQLEEAGLSPKSRTLARDVLARALRWAEQTSVVGRNVARIVQGPKVTRNASDALTADEAKAVLGKAEGDRLEALAVVALRLGLRRGEALGLRWDDVDFDAGELTVAKAKTGAGVRTVPLVAATAAALREHRRRQAAERLAAERSGRTAATCSPTSGVARSIRGSRSAGGTNSPRPPVSAAAASTPPDTHAPSCCSTRACPSRSSQRCSGTPTSRSPPTSMPASPPTPSDARSASSTTLGRTERTPVHCHGDHRLGLRLRDRRHRPQGPARVKGRIVATAHHARTRRRQRGALPQHA